MVASLIKNPIQTLELSLRPLIGLLQAIGV
jgi:hypothetical protein